MQAMVFGNLGESSGTGVCFTRNPSTGKNTLYGGVDHLSLVCRCRDLTTYVLIWLRLHCLDQFVTGRTTCKHCTSVVSKFLFIAVIPIAHDVQLQCAWCKQYMRRKLRSGDLNKGYLHMLYQRPQPRSTQLHTLIARRILG